MEVVEVLTEVDIYSVLSGVVEVFAVDAIGVVVLLVVCSGVVLIVSLADVWSMMEGLTVVVKSVKITKRNFYVSDVKKMDIMT